MRDQHTAAHSKVTPPHKRGPICGLYIQHHEGSTSSTPSSNWPSHTTAPPCRPRALVPYSLLRRSLSLSASVNAAAVACCLFTCACSLIQQAEHGLLPIFISGFGFRSCPTHRILGTQRPVLRRLPVLSDMEL